LKQSSISDFPFNAMVLSAGLGTRFRPHTQFRAKPTIPFLNIPFIYYSLNMAEVCGAKRVAFNLHHRPQDIRDLLYVVSKPMAEYRYSDETKKLLGTGGGILQARDDLIDSDCVLITNADTACIMKDDLANRSFYEAHSDSSAYATLLAMEHPEVGSTYGALWVDDQQQIKAIGKATPADTSLTPLHFTGVYWLAHRVFSDIPKEGASDILLDTLLPAIKKGERVQVFKTDCHWFSGGSLDQYLSETKNALTSLETLVKRPYFNSLLQRFWPKFSDRKSLWEGANCSLPQHKAEFLLTGNNCKVDASAKLTGFVILGENVCIDSGCQLHNCVIPANSIIKSDTVVKDDLFLNMKLNRRER